MQKKLIALAVAGLVSAPAFAQSNVTIYGLIDMGVHQYKSSGSVAGDEKLTSVGGSFSQNGTGALNGSRIGFRGTEDLGNGLKAGFVIEYGVNLTNGEYEENDGGLAANTTDNVVGQGLGRLRQGHVSLSGGFGTVLAGTTYSPVDATSGFVAGAQAHDGTNSPTGAAALFKFGQLARAGNAVVYVTPTFSGLRAAVGYHNSDAVTDSGSGDGGKTNRSPVFAIDYKNGPIAAGYAYQKLNDVTTAGAAGDNLAVINLVGTNNDVALPQFGGRNADLTYHVVGGSYDFGVAKVGLNYASYEAEFDTFGFDTNGATAGGVVNIAPTLESKQTSLSVKVPVTANFWVGGAYTDGDIEADGRVLGKDKTDTSGIDLVAVYSLSKRTNIYALAAQTKFELDGELNDGRDRKQTQYGVGLRHSF